MGRRRLTAHVHLVDDDGDPHVFGPRDTVPAWAAARITNPAAWSDTDPSDDGDDPDDEHDGDGGDPGDDPAGDLDEHDGEGDDERGGDTPDELVPGEVTPLAPPARSGKGSSRDAWATYAQHMQVEVDPQWNRDDIIEALEHHGIATD
ncbi:hypothetical protein WY02_03560 [Pseudonocardia sp. AL041005-10]|nr:hypothetical protein [Pseudonocardia sp. AL041005-10]ALE77679.1 hypothetical protein WY02_03560 [Pseudonocardia sp. AL041005-10]